MEVGGVEDDDDDDDYYFNLCEEAAIKGWWEIVELAHNHGCSCSDDILAELAMNLTNQPLLGL